MNFRPYSVREPEKSIRCPGERSRYPRRAAWMIVEKQF
jgi:hypothetical protein